MSGEFEKSYRETFDSITPDEDVRQKVLTDMENNERKASGRDTLRAAAVSPINYGKRIRRRRMMKRVTAMAACLCLFAAVILWSGLIKPRDSAPIDNVPLPEGRRTVEVTALQVESYSVVYEMLSAPSKIDAVTNSYENGINSIIKSSNNAVYSSFAAPFSFSRAAGGYAVASNSFDGYYSGTNLQVAGVDEADVVKTDGKTIYALRAATFDDHTGKMKTPSEIVIIQAQGKDSRFLSRVSAPMPTETESEDGKTVTTAATVFYDMYLAGETLVIIADTSSHTQPTAGNEILYNEYARNAFPFSSSFRPLGWWSWAGSNETTAFLYDISDRTAPVLRDSFGQSGAYQSSRLVNSVLYTITNHYVNYKGDQSDTELYIPQLNRGVDAVTNSLIPACDINIMPSEEKGCYSQFTVICAIDISGEPERLSAKTLLGSTDTIYASGENLLLAGSVDNLDKEYGPYEEIGGMASYSYSEEDYNEETGYNPKLKVGVLYRHVTQTSSQRTILVLFGLNGGDIEHRATGEIPGSLLNQFSMDEFDGHFRIVTTADNWVGDCFEDEDGDDAWFEPDEAWYLTYGSSEKYAGYSTEGEWLYYTSHPQYRDGIHWGNNYVSSNALYVLDGALERVGALEGLAEDERVYSVRFTGDIGYFVTYKQVDPLFTVDLSDPANPYIRSELKIPGFSEYLHPYDDGLLLGLGQNTTVNEWGGESRDGLKLSMFDVSDPDNVTESSVLALPFDWTEASSNHKAVLVSRARALVAFPVDGSYAIYGYSEETGFFERAIVKIDEKNWWQGNSRGLFIGDDFYVISQNAVYIFSVPDFSPLATVDILAHAG